MMFLPVGSIENLKAVHGKHSFHSNESGGEERETG